MSITSRTLIAATLLLSLAVIGFVLFSEHVQHYAPCELCLRERLPWYAIIWLSVVGLLPRRLTLIGLAFPSRWLLVLIGLTLLVSAALGLHHAGVEQHWWPGPTACTSGSSGAKTIDELRALLHKEKVVQCDEIAWKLFGL